METLLRAAEAASSAFERHRHRHKIELNQRAIMSSRNRVRACSWVLFNAIEQIIWEDLTTE